MEYSFEKFGKIVVSHYQLRKALYGWATGQKEINMSLDLGRTESYVAIKNDKIIFPNGFELEISKLKKLILNQKVCYYIADSLYKVYLFSEETNKLYKLVPTGEKTPPTLEISGIHMHKIKDTDPLTDTLNKITILKPTGRVLDVGTGLGYTAIYSSIHGAEEVITVEKDLNVLEIAKYNPWSWELFNDQKIKIITAPIEDYIYNFDDCSFDRIMHDPPRFTNRTTILYSSVLYKEFYRILKKDGILVHYVGKPKYKRGFNLAKRVEKRLRDVGFKKIEFFPECECIRAIKC